jgi:hypothetical protein
MAMRENAFTGVLPRWKAGETGEEAKESKYIGRF